jgi:hypothetical protein
MFTRQSKLENFKFDVVPRSTALLKRQTYKDKHRSTNNSIVIIQRSNKTKKMRTIE